MISTEFIKGWEKVLKNFRNKSPKRKYHNKLDSLVKRFVDKLENKNVYVENLYIKILKSSVAWNKDEIMQDMIEKIKVFQDYDEEEINFNYKPFLEKLKQEKLD